MTDTAIKTGKTEPIQMTAAELRELPEYSCSLPTGTTIGKQWKCDYAAFGRKPPGSPKEWWMAEYVDDPAPDMVGIVWRRIIVIEPYRAPNRFVAWLVRSRLLIPPRYQVARAEATP